MATGEDLRSFTVAGPVQAELLVLVLQEGKPHLSGPCGPEPWYVEVPQGADPMEVAGRLARVNLGSPRLVHSTSWRTARGGVVLSFVVVMDALDLPSVPVQRTELARGGPTTPPEAIEAAPVIEHALRHLAWLVKDDPVVADELSADWHAVLSDYVPEPFRPL
jgi:hypothetical protein